MESNCEILPFITNVTPWLPDGPGFAQKHCETFPANQRVFWPLLKAVFVGLTLVRLSEQCRRVKPSLVDTYTSYFHSKLHLAALQNI